jgi:hypothetical protein
MSSAIPKGSQPNSPGVEDPGIERPRPPDPGAIAQNRRLKLDCLPRSLTDNGPLTVRSGVPRSLRLPPKKLSGVGPYFTQSRKRVRKTLRDSFPNSFQLCVKRTPGFIRPDRMNRIPQFMIQGEPFVSVRVAPALLSTSSTTQPPPTKADTVAFPVPRQRNKPP